MGIVVVFNTANIEGESTVSGYDKAVDALSLRDAIEVATPQASGRARAGRTSGQTKHSNIELIRYKDRASPKLSEACAAGDNLGKVDIHLYRTLETGVQVYMTYRLDAVYVSRIENDTQDANGVVFQPHFVAASEVNPAPVTGVASVLSGLARGQGGVIRTAPRPAVGATRGAPQTREVERVWLNAAKVWWKYTPFQNGRAQGAIEKGWDIQKGAMAA